MMALKVKAVERLVKFNKEDAGVYRNVMTPELYIALSLAKSDPRSSSPLGRESRAKIFRFPLPPLFVLLVGCFSNNDGQNAVFKRKTFLCEKESLYLQPSLSTLRAEVRFDVSIY
jgi:hypothetical protein